MVPIKSSLKQFDAAFVVCDVVVRQEHVVARHRIDTPVVEVPEAEIRQIDPADTARLRDRMASVGGRRVCDDDLGGPDCLLLETVQHAGSTDSPW